MPSDLFRKKEYPFWYCFYFIYYLYTFVNSLLLRQNQSTVIQSNSFPSLSFGDNIIETCAEKQLYV